MSCTDRALVACLPAGAGYNGTVTFDCGPSPVTITVASTMTILADTIIDGGGLMTISGGGMVEVFFVRGDMTFVVENLTVANGVAAGLGYGGGIFNDGGTVIITNSTFTGNSAGAGGGGIYNGRNGVQVIIANSIAADNTGGNCGGSSITEFSPGGHNLDDGTSCGFSTANGSLNNTNPHLDPAGLKNNGGPTQTIAIQPGSPAINAGDEVICATGPVWNLDQRGFVRPGVGATSCSIGAYEFDSPGPWPCVGDCNNDGHVRIDEILTMVGIALGNGGSCPNGIPAGATLDVSLVLQAVNNALNGCDG